MTDDRTWMTNDQNLTYRFNNGVPNQLTESISPWVNNARAAWDGVFVAGAVDARPSDAAGRAPVRSRRAAGSRSSRKDRRDSCLRRSSFPRRAASTATRTSRRGSASSFDLFGTGRTALKMSLGKYLEGAGVTGNYANTNPTLRLPQTTSVLRHGRRDAGLDRCQRQLRARLRSAEPGRPGSTSRRRRFVRRRCRTRASARTF